MTERERKLWVRRLAAEWNRPTLDQFYQMQIAAKVQTGWSFKYVPTDEMKIQFERKAEPEQLTDEEMQERIREVSETRRAIVRGNRGYSGS